MGKKLWYHSKYLLLLLFCSNSFAQVKPADFKYVDHILGYWRMPTKHSTFTEYWIKLDENTWQGVTHRITGKDSVEMDHMQLERRGKDLYFSIVAVSDPKSGKPVPFKVTVIQANGFVAENPECDYPQKIVYKWKKEDELEVHYKGEKEKTFSEIILEYKRK
ncbi:MULTISPECIES: DUF6265 family protein [unclassified Chitinophaga]|uniref:DUF6265 family protein n=1 Tax=unclassified Chitinophaga TaxID=2619133 RepID=UPI0009D40B0D|nr:MULTISPECIES: DUF6265 family protein [unclassified Chitinophaga]OMP77750.1 hypothetical protein BW716_18650 [[Flexibacter] sp. ATCC 35208]WPV65538.1 DUF6265 family protein [Chitinophaga sp. LS1]